MVMSRLDLIHPIDDLLRLERVPYTLCPGCGIGIALQQTLRAIKDLEAENKLDRNDIVFVTGIGCTARESGLVKLDSIHSIHGRAIPFAVGAKLANPRLKPLVFSGDGDISGIGGNHLIHAARKNFDVMVIMINNFTYALTGGQLAPTTPFHVYSTTTPAGNPETPFNVSKFLTALKPNYVARWSVTHLTKIKDSVKKAFMKRGFRFIEILSTCPEIYGRHIGLRDPFELYTILRKIAKVRNNASFDEIKYDWNTEITCGEFVDKDDPSYLDNLKKCMESE